jgi:hypothetical protein
MFDVKAKHKALATRIAQWIFLWEWEAMGRTVRATLESDPRPIQARCFPSRPLCLVGMKTPGVSGAEPLTGELARQRPARARVMSMVRTIESNGEDAMKSKGNTDHLLYICAGF